VNFDEVRSYEANLDSQSPSEVCKLGIVTKEPPCVARLQVVRDGRCHGPEITPGLKLSASFWQSILFSSDSETFGSSRLTLSL
jgi:hypothetical protein